MSKIIDIDLDFFQNGVVRNFGDQLIGKNGLKPWRENDVRKYFENNIGISSPVPGRVFDTHDKAFYFWRELLEQNLIKIPCEVDHIDAHSDMGFGDTVWRPMINSYMHLSPGKRTSMPLSNMNEGNYVLFAFAMGWISKFNYIHHEKYEDDLLQCWFENFDLNSDKIQMVACDNLETDDFFDLKNRVHKITHRDSSIDFRLIASKQYKNKDKISFLSLAISPIFICQSTKKKILPIIEEYIEKI